MTSPIRICFPHNQNIKYLTTKYGQASKEYLEQSAGVLLIMRNPYDAFKAEFNRKQTQRGVVNGVRGRSHVGHADPAGFTLFCNNIRVYESQQVSDRSIVLRKILL